MNKKLLKSTSVLVAALVAGPIFASTASALSTGGDYKSDGYIKFEEGDNSTTVTPVDPLAPVDPVVPKDPDGSDPEPGGTGALTIDFASSLSFGTQKISSVDATYYAHAQWLTEIKGVTGDFTRPDYVQVTDTRGTWGGWTLTVAEEDQFKTAAGDVLTGAELKFTKGYTDGTTTAVPSYVNATDFVVGTAAQKILGAGVNQGMGTWVYGLGGNADYEENGGAHLGLDAISTKSPITLKVVAGTNKAAVYRTNLKWSLTDAPGN